MSKVMKKNLLLLFNCVNYIELKHIIRIMKITTVLTLIAVFQLSATTLHSQNAKVSISRNNLPLKEFIQEIEKQTDYLFMYSEKEINLQEEVHVNAKNKPVSTVLEEVFGNSKIAYNFNEGYISLRKAEIEIKSVNQTKRKISGVVTDATGEPIIGANVVVKGTTDGSITDIDGKFSLDVPEGTTLEISYIGYLTQTIPVRNKSSFQITLQEDTQKLDEVVVVGFGTQKKVNLTGSIGTVKTEEVLKSRPVTNVQELLSSSVPGMAVTKGSGAAGSGASINIRGTSTIGGSSGVLVLIDGMPGNIYTLNPNDIESVSVLKDAASAAIYGSRAANGVILVTTKTAKATDRPVVEFSSNIGIQNPQFKLDFVGAEDFMRLYDQAMINDGKEAVYGEQGIQDLHAGKYVDNKWYKEIYKKNTIINNTHIAVSGKEKAISYRFSVSNDYQEGNLPNNNYNRLVFKPDMRFQILKNLEAHASLQYTQTNIQNPNGGTTIWQTQAARISPVTPIYNPDGSYAAGGAMGGNPIAGVNESGYSKERHKEMMAIFDVSYSPLKDWNIKIFSKYNNKKQSKYLLLV